MDRQQNLTLGIDTGGTYTDAVLFEPKQGVLAAAKALTTKHDLSLGIGEATAKVLGGHGRDVGLVSISTTLATNALVEGHGSRAGLFLIGFDRAALGRGGLGEALGDDPVAFLQGGNTAHGDPAVPLDRAELAEAVLAQAGSVSAFAVAGHFAVRNPAQEIAVRDFVRQETGLPVTCSHELTSNLDAPRRALTTLLNARLIALLQDLITSVQGLMEEQAIKAPLMVVKGDGSLISAETALSRPIETILSGPAASVTGARFLSGESDALISDIGGTTTDVAILRDGLPLVSRDGATVGGWRTMVEAISVRTYGLGGDSEVRFERGPELRLGPRRAVPLSLLASRHQEVVAQLAAQREADGSDPNLGRFALRNRRSYAAMASLSRSESEIWDELAEGPVALAALSSDYLRRKSLERLLDRGLVVVAGFTPSDAAHLLGLQCQWNRDAAEHGAALMMRRAEREAGGLEVGTPKEFAEAVAEQVRKQSGYALLESVLTEMGAPPAAGGLGQFLLDRSLAADRDAGDALSRLLDVGLRLQVTLVGAGAPAAIYYPEVAQRLGARLSLPEHCEVANAVGAAASAVVQRVSCLITAPEDGRFRVHIAEQVRDFANLESAAAFAEREGNRLAHDRAAAAGGVDIEVTSQRDDSIVEVPGGPSTFVESRVIVQAVGRPRTQAVGQAV